MKRLVLLLRAATARQAAPEESPEESLEAGGRLPGLLERQWYYPLGSYLNKITPASNISIRELTHLLLTRAQHVNIIM